MLETRLTTPIDKMLPFDAVLDHGLLLVHELGGKPRNYLHEVSVQGKPSELIAYLLDAGYGETTGYRKDGQQFWCYSKRFPLSIASW